MKYPAFWIGFCAYIAYTYGHDRGYKRGHRIGMIKGIANSIVFQMREENDQEFGNE